MGESSSAARLAGLVMDVRQGDTIAIGHNIRITVLSKSGRVARVRIAAPLDIRVKKDATAGADHPGDWAGT